MSHIWVVFVEYRVGHDIRLFAEKRRACAWAKELAQEFGMLNISGDFGVWRRNYRNAGTLSSDLAPRIPEMIKVSEVAVT